MPLSQILNDPSLCPPDGPGFLTLLHLDKGQHPVFQVQMHIRCRVPFLKIMPLDAVLAKLRVANPQLIFAHVMHFVAPIAVWCSAADDKAHPLDNTIMQRNVNVNSDLVFGD
jgi:hypothetical protein